MKVSFVYPRFEKFLESIPDLNLTLVNHFLGNYRLNRMDAPGPPYPGTDDLEIRSSGSTNSPTKAW